MLCFGRLTAVLGIICLSASVAFADPQVQEDPLGPDGQCVGGSISPQGDHAAVLATKGSHYVVLYDGAEGPQIDGLLANLNPSSAFGPPITGADRSPCCFATTAAIGCTWPNPAISTW